MFGVTKLLGGLYKVRVPKHSSLDGLHRFLRDVAFMEKYTDETMFMCYVVKGYSKVDAAFHMYLELDPGE